MRKLLLAICGAAVLAATPGFGADTPSCVRRNDVRSWYSPVRKTLLLESYTGHKIKLTMSGSCQGFGPYDTFQITGPLEGAATCISKGDFVKTNWAGEPGLCTITDLQPFDGPVKTPQPHMP